MAAKPKFDGWIVVHTQYHRFFKNLPCTTEGLKNPTSAFVRHIGGMEFCHVETEQGNLTWMSQLRDAFWQFGRPLHFLIVGSAEDDLVEHLAIDLAIVATQAGVSADEILQNRDLDLTTFQQRDLYTEKGVFVLLCCPSLKQLEDHLRYHMNDMPSLDTSIYYSGHGLEPSGEWYLNEETCYSGHDLKEFLASLNRKHGGDMYLFLNSCFGLPFVSSMQDTFKTAILGDLFAYHFDWFKKYKTTPAKLALSASTLGEDQCVQANATFAWLVLQMYKECQPGTFPSAMVGSNPLRIVPFAPGPLDASGILQKMYMIPASTVSCFAGSISRGGYPKLHRISGSLLPPKPNIPELFLFPAGFGDSTLIRFDGINILIDGGASTISPSFWPVVSRLPKNEKLDVVILTHQDIDHLRGIKRLLQSAPTEMIGQVYCLKPPDDDSKSLTGATPGGAEVWNLAGATKQKELKPGVIDLKRTDVELRLLAPEPAVAAIARRYMKLTRNLSAPNLASGIVYFKATTGTLGKKSIFRALFTGDAPAETVVEALKTYDLHGGDFDFIDVPHHGSKLNNSHLLFDGIRQVRVAAVSTDGKGQGKGTYYCHPDPETLDLLKKQLDAKTIEQVAFTYKKHNKDGKKQMNGTQTSRNKDVQDWLPSGPKCFYGGNDYDMPLTHCVKLKLGTSKCENIALSDGV